MAEVLNQIAKDLYDGLAEEVAAGTTKALDHGIAPEEILNRALIAGMNNVGRDFKADILYVPEVLIAARAMHAGMNILKPLLAASGVSFAGKLVIGTVKGDLHDIGKNLVGMMLEGAGFEVVDLGIDVAPEAFVKAVQEHTPSIVGLSALLTTTMVSMKTTIDALLQAEVRDSIKVMIGGAPVTASFAEQIGADAYAPDAATAVDIARNLVG
jgi:5-methyltetrahydrofolate--homocysteine methyltransferase